MEGNSRGVRRVNIIIRRPFIDHLQLMPQAYVSSDLIMQVIPAQDAMIWAHDLRQVDEDRPRIYRRLDLAWYAWLHRRMTEARAMHAQGQIPEALWQISRTRFNAVWAVANRRWSSASIAQAIAKLPATYVAPARAA
jgi:hypothetical protein